MKRIGIDARLYFQTGVGVYIRNFLHNLQKCNNSYFEYVIYVLEEDVSRIQIENPHFTFRTTRSRWHSFDEQISFYFLIQKDNIDLMHFTYYSYPILYNRPFVATIHDLTPLKFRTGKASTKNKLIYNIKYFVLRYVFFKESHSSLMIFTPTDYTKRQILDEYPDINANKIIVTYEGINHELVESQSLDNNLESDYYLYVGNFYPHKNVDYLVDSYFLSHIKSKLVLVGPGNEFMSKLKKRVSDLGIQNKVLFRADISNEELSRYYRYAKALIYPSFSEGLGLPVIEASFFKIPIIASNIPVFKELLGESYISFDPHIKKDLQQILEKVEKHPSSLILPELKQECSFEKMTQKIHSMYSTLLNNS
ncbi:MAG: glycosyltransferase family 1 protein [Candidatus Roizmanbacteria bacterium]